EDGAAPMDRRSVGATSALYRHIVGGEIVSFFLRRLYCIGLERSRPRILRALPVPANHLFAHLDAHQPLRFLIVPGHFRPIRGYQSHTETLLSPGTLSPASRCCSKCTSHFESWERLA